MIPDKLQNNKNDSVNKLDSKVIPVMREAVTLVQLALFAELKINISHKYRTWSDQKRNRLAGAVVNSLFGIKIADAQSAEFAGHNREAIEEELRGIKEACPDLLDYLTDALRMQALCDEQEGINSLANLLLARALGVLVEERPLPMPSTFMLFVRQLGAKYSLIEPLNGK